MDKYKNFSVEDLLQDEFFCQWVKDPFSKNAELWEEWLNDNPEMREVVQEARNITDAFHYQPETVPKDFYENLKNRIDSTINDKGYKHRSISLTPLWLKIAAAFLGVVLIAGIFYYSYFDKGFITYSSKYAETKNIVLPDGSEVVLNANSFLKYSKNWNEKNREIWLNGEGFFKIKHIEDLKKVPEKFVVHTSNIKVEVLGTEFNINTNNDNKTEVLLTNGRVKLSVNEGNTKPVNLLPDDLFFYNNTTKISGLNKVVPENYIAWIDHKYIFEKAPLEDVCKELNRYYGKAFTIKDAKMRRQRLSGTLELQNEEALVLTLAALLGVRVDRKDDQIIIFSQ